MVPTLVFDLTKVISNHDNLETLFAFYFQTYQQPCCVSRIFCQEFITMNLTRFNPLMNTNLRNS